MKTTSCNKNSQDLECTKKNIKKIGGIRIEFLNKSNSISYSPVLKWLFNDFPQFLENFHTADRVRKFLRDRITQR